ncbi:hypothetical protein [Candidatus Methylomirabilis sp.]|uniref:hypothetical protein n=1 Tax=Candidatus Methylomirabilis sp. TaxID=2032687 RepID=UPI0030765B4E
MGRSALSRPRSVHYPSRYLGTGILLARQPAIIDRNRWLFLLKQEFIQAVEGSLRRESRSPTGHLFRLNSALRYDSCADSWSKSALSGSRKIPEKLLFENLLLSAG